jgi:hypothetical protein
VCRLAHGFVFRDGDAYAVYNIALYAGHPDCCALLQIAVGDDWSDDANPDARLAVALELQPVGQGLATRVIDAAETPWSGVVLGTRVLDRAEALAHPRLSGEFHKFRYLC